MAHPWKSNGHATNGAAREKWGSSFYLEKQSNSRRTEVRRGAIAGDKNVWQAVEAQTFLSITALPPGTS
jgi:hypothetical protein